MTTGRGLKAVVSIGGTVAASLPTSAKRAAQELDRLAQAQARDRRESRRLSLEMRSLSRSSQAYSQAAQQQRMLRERMAERGVQIRGLGEQAGQATGLLGRLGSVIGRLGPWGAAAGAGIGVASAALVGLGRAIDADAASARRLEDTSISTGASTDEIYRLTRGLQTLTGDYERAESAAAGFHGGQSRIRRALAGYVDFTFDRELAFAGLTPEDLQGDLGEVTAAVRLRLEAGVDTDVLHDALMAAQFGESSSLIIALAQDQERLNAALEEARTARPYDPQAYDDWTRATSTVSSAWDELRRDITQGSARSAQSIGDIIAAINALRRGEQGALADLGTAGLELVTRDEDFARIVEDVETIRSIIDSTRSGIDDVIDGSERLHQRMQAWSVDLLTDPVRTIAETAREGRPSLDDLLPPPPEAAPDYAPTLERPDIAAQMIPAPIWQTAAPPALERPDIAAQMVPAPIWQTAAPMERELMVQEAELIAALRSLESAIDDLELPSSRRPVGGTGAIEVSQTLTYHAAPGGSLSEDEWLDAANAALRRQIEGLALS